MRQSATKSGSLGIAMLFIFSCLVCQAANSKSAQDQNNAGTTAFTGIIMDSACAQMGSHSEMEQKHGMKGSDKLTGAEARKCTDLCVKNGSTYVLYDPSNKTTYQLSDQDKAKMFAGDSVRVKGTYDESSKTITVSSITRSRPRTMSHGH
jgi:hypothetical protein